MSSVQGTIEKLTRTDLSKNTSWLSSVVVASIRQSTSAHSDAASYATEKVLTAFYIELRNKRKWAKHPLIIPPFVYRRQLKGERIASASTERSLLGLKSSQPPEISRLRRKNDISRQKEATFYPVGMGTASPGPLRVDAHKGNRATHFANSARDPLPGAN